MAKFSKISLRSIYGLSIGIIIFFLILATFKMNRVEALTTAAATRAGSAATRAGSATTKAAVTTKAGSATTRAAAAAINQAIRR